MGPTIGNSIVIPHIRGVSVIGEFGVIIDGVLSHLSLFVACTIEKDQLLGRLVDNILATGRKAGLVKEKRNSAGVKATSQPGPPHYSYFYGAKKHSTSAARMVRH